MKAIFKDDKRLLVRNINKEERVLIDSFVRKFQTYIVEITDLIDIDNNLDGITFTITDEPRNKIHYDEPYTQILIQDTTTYFDLNVERGTTITLVNDYPDRVRAVLDRSEVHLYAYEIPSLEGTTKQYTLYAKLTREGCEQTTVPINVTVIYRRDIGVTNYGDLENLPKINQVTVINDKSLGQYGIQEEMKKISNSTIVDIIDDSF